MTHITSQLVKAIGLNFNALLLLILLFNPCWADNLSSIDHRLELADQIRSSSPSEFQGIIQELQSESQAFSQEQRHYFNYLNAYQLAFSGKFDESLNLWISITESDASEVLKFRSNLSLVNILAISKKWTDGLSRLSLNLKMLPKIENEKLKQLGILAASLFYNLLGQYELGLRYANKLDDLVSEGRNACLAKQLAIEAKLKLNLLDENSIEITEGIDICEKNNEKLMTAIIYTHLASLHLAQNKNSEVIDLLDSKIESVEQINYAPVSAIFYSQLAEAFMQLENVNQAERFASATLEKSQNIGNNEPTVNAYRVLYQIAESRGDHKMALEYHKKFAEADKAYLDDIKTKHLAFQLAEHQATEQKSRIGLLDKQNNLLKIEQKLARSEAENNRLFIALLIAIITLLSFWGYKSWMTQKRLKQLAEFDALTGVFNRGHFTQLAQSALQYCENSDIYLSCILFDLDKFKTINDSYGHACGDWVLKRVADVCKVQGRSNDIFARLGGEEFCILLPGCDLLTATKLAETCRKAIAQIDTRDSGAGFIITASFGVTDAKLSGYDLEKITADADMAMYCSKHDGRNRTTVFGRALVDENGEGEGSESRQGHLTL